MLGLWLRAMLILLMAVVLLTVTMVTVGQGLPYEGELRYFLIDAADGLYTPYTMDIVRGLSTPLYVGLPAAQADWSPDNQYIIVWSIDTTYVLGAHHGELRRLSGDHVVPIWSPDGTWLAFESFTSAAYRLMLANGDGTNVTEFNDFDGSDFRQPSFSLDGTQLAYIRDRDLYVWDLATSSSTRLTHTPEQDEVQPNWSPDGRWIAFTWRDTAFINHVSVVSSDGSTRRDFLSDSEAQAVTPLWSPDSTQIAFVLAGDESLVYVAVPETNELRPVTMFTASLALASAQWQADNRTLQVFWLTTATGAFEFHIDQVDSVTGETLQREILPSNFMAVSPDENWVVVYEDDTICIQARVTGEIRRCHAIAGGAPLNFRWLP